MTKNELEKIKIFFLYFNKQQQQGCLSEITVTRESSLVVVFCWSVAVATTTSTTTTTAIE